MSHLRSPARRRLLQALGLAVPLAAIGVTPGARGAAAAPLLDAAAPEAKAVKYVEDAAQASGASPGSTCANCALYQGAYASTQGPCQLFAGKSVAAKGWCSGYAKKA